MKVGDMVKHAYSKRGMLGIIMEIVSWRHAETMVAHLSPFVLWDDGRYEKCMAGLLEVINESR
jgi:hypothetical protein